jgi:hypothetical protein
MQSNEGMRALLGTILMCSATALAAPGDAPPPAPMGPSGSAQPVDPYQRGPVTSPAQTAPDTSAPTDASPAAPAPSQQQPPANAPQPDTQRTPPDHPPPPASEQKPNPEIDKPGPAPVDTPAPPVNDQQSSRDGSGSAAKTDAPASNAPGNVEPKASGTVDATASNAPGNVAPSTPGNVDSNLSSNVASTAEPNASNAPGNVEPAPVVEQLGPEIDVENAPPACRDAGKLAQSRDRGVVLSAKISFAICTANAALAPLQLVDAEASVQEVDRVTSNSLALLSDVANAGDPKWAIVALHAEGDLLATMAKRMMDTVPANQPAELRDMRTQMLQPHLQPWVERARKAFAEVDRLAKANPRLAKNQVVATAVTDSRKRLGTGVATR